MGAGIDAQAQAHYNRVIADGGLIPSGLVGVNNFFKTVKAIYGTSDITTAISVGLDAQVLGYKLGAGAGTTTGQAAQKLYSCSGASGDVVQTTAASQPLLLVHEGANYFFSPKIEANYCSTPSNNVISTDFEIIVKLSTFNVATDGMVISKQIDGFQRSFYLYYVGNQTFDFTISTNGSSTASTASSTSYGISNNDVFWIKVNRTGTTFNFYKSTDGVSYSLINTTTLSGAIFAGNSPIRIGDGLDGISYLFAGKIYRATISNSIGGAPVVDFNPSQYNAATSQTQWTSTTGEVWTINQSVGNTLKGTIVDRTKTQFVRGLYSMQTGTGTVFLTGNNVTYSEYVAAQLSENLSQSSPVTLKGVGSAQIDFGTTSAIQFYAQDNAGAVRRFDPSFSFSYLLNIFNIIGDSTTTAYLNNVAGSSSSNAQTTTTINQVSLSGSSNYNNFTGVFNTLILTSQADNSTQRTAIWNIIKIINNL
jgi:hypothetical protein